MRRMKYGLPLWFILACLECDGQPGVVQPGFTCTANAGNPVIVRVEGITELVGDLLLQCTGGQPTPAGQPVPASNIRLTLNTNITSRILGSSGYSDALLLLDDPYPAPGTQVPSTIVPPNSSPLQNFCPSPFGCQVLGTGGVSNPYFTQPNIYPARQTATNQVEWDGVPIDAPGTNNIRTIR
jgi:hypothetical protein